MSRATETKNTLRVLREELRLCLCLHEHAKAALKQDISEKWRKRLSAFTSDTFLRLIVDLDQDIELLELEQEIFSDV